MNDNSTSHVARTLDDLRQQFNSKMEEARKILNAINTLEELAGETQTSMPDFGEDHSPRIQQAGDMAPIGTSLRGQTSGIRPDEYLGQKPLDAAKKYIERVGHAVTIEDVAKAIQMGGAAISGANWHEKLDKSLTRSTYDVIKVKEGVFGLVKFYSDEQIKGIRGTRQQNKPKDKRS